jgi:hypothetical protein
MERIPLNVTEEEFLRLNQLYPPTVKSSTVGERAIELVQLHFRSKDPKCAFSTPTDGSDLEIKSNNTAQYIEVKGTADTEIAWAKLKVSGQPSYNLLSQGLPLYRVCGVYNRDPVIFILSHGKDFEMVPEPRWSVRAKTTA